MRFDILTIFPNIFQSYFAHSLMARAIKKKLITLKVHDLRHWTTDKHKTVDDRPYGGGVGMVMRVDIVDRALRALRKSEVRGHRSVGRSRIILLTPQGKAFSQRHARRLQRYYDRLILVSGRYEGFDERIRKFADEEISIGDYVLTGGELPAMVVIDAVARLVPGVVGKQASLDEESFSQGLLEYPQYTRPPAYKGMRVPKLLLSGNHAEIKKWREQEAKKRTKKRRPELLQNAK